MKRKIIHVLASFVLIAAMSACGNGEAEKKAAEEKEAARLDSIHNELQKSEADVQAKKESLEKALEEMNAPAEDKSNKK